MDATQGIHVGMIHARKIATVTVSDDGFQISLDGETISVVPRQHAGDPPVRGLRNRAGKPGDCIFAYPRAMVPARIAASGSASR